MIFAMNAPTLITLIVVLVLLFFAVRHIYKQVKADGTGCSGCGSSSGCCGCPSVAPVEKKEPNKNNSVK